MTGGGDVPSRQRSNMAACTTAFSQIIYWGHSLGQPELVCGEHGPISALDHCSRLPQHSSVRESALTAPAGIFASVVVVENSKDLSMGYLLAAQPPQRGTGWGL